jgi:hypothetical protein
MTTMVMSDTALCVMSNIFARVVSGNASVGLNAVDVLTRHTYLAPNLRS